MAGSGPLARYQALTNEQHITADPAQHAVASRLEDCYQTLLERRRSLIDRWRRRYRPSPGVYLHGPVGRGKTMLMDLLATSLTGSGIPIWRIHFHRFMDQMHAGLAARGKQRDPLPDIARELAGRCRVLCLDELHVGDIGDAMLLGGLLQALFERGLTLVATSNSAPGDLYAGGLQRQRFIPAIEAIEAHCQIISLTAETDYRLRKLSRHRSYYCPDTAENRAELAANFASLAGGTPPSDRPLKLRGRLIQPIQRAGSVVWFDFATLCEGPRSSADYIDLARRFSTLVISAVPALSERDNDAARRFIHLIDECYDRSVKLIISAAAPPESLYTGQRLAAAFERTSSRLIEMQSHAYLARDHRA